MDLHQPFKGMDLCLSRRQKHLYRRSLSNASKGLTFSQDVMWERGPDNIQYSKADFSWLFCTSGLLAPITTSKRRKHGGTKALPCQARFKGFVMPPFFTVTDHQHVSTIQEKEKNMTSNRDKSVGEKTTKNTFQQISGGYRFKSRLVQAQNESVTITDLRNDESKDKKDFCGIYSLSKFNTKPKALKSRESRSPLSIFYRIKGYSVSPVRIGKDGGSNRMENNVQVNYMELPKLPCLQDSVNPHAEKCINNTENIEMEPHTGIAKQVHRPDRETVDCIRDIKTLQGSFSYSPERWTDFPSAGLQSVTEADATELGFRTPEAKKQDTEAPNWPIHINPTPGPSCLCYAVEGWRKAWKIKANWHSVSFESLKKDLTDLHWQVRVAAIATCASAAVNRRKVGPDPDKTAQLDQNWQPVQSVEAVHPDLQLLIFFALNDPVKRVQLAAAVCQYGIGTPNADARNILQKALQHDSSRTRADSWVAAQCLAIEGEASQTVIERLISQLFFSNFPSDQEQAAALLASISSKSILVQSLLGEQLNCAEWRNRILVCQTISKLKYPINKDLTNKLLYLMWNDWSNLVRQAAAQALDKLGLGSAIHSELSVKLCAGPTPWRVEALVLIGQLKIMTAKLLPGFLQCLNDEFLVVRSQACLAAASIMTKDEMIQNKLLHLMQNDPSCDVKVAAINALARIGWLTPTLQGLLLWTLQHEKEPSVRIAACEAIKLLEVKAPELQNLLQKHLALETNSQVQRHMKDLMKHCGYSLERVKGMSQMITEQVQKLCTKSIITEKLLLLEDLKKQTQQTVPGKESLPEREVLPALDRFRA